MPLRRTRAARRAHIPNTNSQDQRPELGPKRASKGKRAGVAERCLAPAGQKRGEVALALMDHADRRRSDVARPIGQTAQPHHAHALYRRPSVPGSGKLVRVVVLSEMHALTRVPRGQDGVSSCRLGTCAQASAGTRDGTSGQQIGHASLTGAFAEAAGLLLRNHAQGQTWLVRWENTHGKGQAWTSLAPKWARAVSSMVTRATVLALDRCRNGYGSSGGEPAASLDTPGSSRPSRPWHSALALRHGTRNRT